MCCLPSLGGPDQVSQFPPGGKEMADAAISIGPSWHTPRPAALGPCRSSKSSAQSLAVESFGQLSQLICTGRDLRSLLSFLAERACRVVGGQGSWVGVLSEETGSIVPICSYDTELGIDSGFHCLGVPAVITEGLGFTTKTKREGRSSGLCERGRSLQWSSEAEDGRAQHQVAIRLEFLARPIGLLVVRLTAGEDYEAPDMELLEAFADQTSIVVGTSRLLEEAGKKTRETETINLVAEKLSGPHGLAQKLNGTLDTVLRFLDVDGGVIHLLDPASGELHLTSAHRGVPVSGLSEADNLPPGEGVSSWVVKHRKPLMLSDIQEDKRLIRRDWVRHEQVHCWASAPLISNGQAVGTIGVFNRDWKPMAPETEHLLCAVGRQIGIAAQNASLLEDTMALQKERIHLLRDRLREITTHHEQERARLARDLHDEVAQTLVSSIVGLRMLAKQEAAKIELGQELQTMSDDLAQTLNRSRGIISGLRSALGRKKTFVEAVRDELLAKVGTATGAMCRFECRDWPDDLEPEAALNLYRIVQEALTNIRKHSRPSNISLNLHGTDEHQLEIVVQDDGCGFDLSRMEAALAGDHVGIVGMGERAELLQGAVNVASTPGLGTTLTVLVPRRACLAVPKSDEQGA